MIKNVLLILLLTIQSMVYGQEFSKTQQPYLAVNYIKNAGIESGVTGYSLFNDGASVNPVDGTGGTATITLTSSTTNPLVGTRSLIVTKPSGSSHQGQGFSSDFTIANADRGKVIRSALKYEIASGTYATGDMTLWIYDVTNTKLIQPSAYTIEKSGLQESKFVEWQSSIDSNLYRLIVHISSTSTAAYSLKFDSFESGLGPKVYGSVVTDSLAYTPTFTALSTPTGIDFEYKRIGDEVYINGSFACSGAGSASEARLSLPSGLTTTTFATVSLKRSGDFNRGNANVSSKGGIVIAESGKTYLVFSEASVISGTSADAYSKANGSAVCLANGEIIKVQARLKIAGWSSGSQVISTDAAVGPVTASYQRTGASQTLNASGVPTVMNFNTKIYDDVGMVTVSTDGVSSDWKATAKSPGKYRFTLTGYLDSPTNVTSVQVGYKKNGGGLNYSNGTLGAQDRVQASVTLDMNTGDYFQPIITYTTSSGLRTLYAGQSRIDIEKIQGPSQIMAGESVSFSANTSTTAATTSAPFIYTVEDHDNTNSYSTVTGKFTAPSPGLYHFDVLSYSSSSFTVRLYKGSTVFAEGGSTITGTTSAMISTNIRLLAGETVEVRPNTSVTASGGAALNIFSGYRVGNY